ncbi:MAG TPA: hypothetical protein DEP72_03350 [Clostridiales bacterium]|nr:MAG: hypothetical protein A2Y18_07380 [Clostridiales bacterium GWD2_32_19]HCC07189.1 hypothetical protein [Clostridiales bacterium]
MFLTDVKVGQLRTNCYIIADEDTKECAVIDPGDDYEYIVDTLEKYNLKPTYILITHGHYDHIAEVNKIRDKYTAKVICHEEAVPFLDSEMLNGGFFSGRSVSAINDQIVKEYDIIKLGNIDIKALHVPGHAPGSVCYYIESENIVFTGDTLFKDTIGITDIFPYGDHDLLVKNIKEKLITLPLSTIVYPGHGSYTTIESEVNNNYFLKHKG